MALAAMLAVPLMFAVPWARPPQIHISDALPWISDDEHWGKRDYWATPIEMLATNGGDCEDFSIAKYLTLTQLRVPSDKLRITYVRAPRLR